MNSRYLSVEINEPNGQPSNEITHEFLDNSEEESQMKTKLSFVNEAIPEMRISSHEVSPGNA
jgi:hypothetical protein